MKEILGGNLKRFFDAIDSKCSNSDITYAGDRYEVWSITDELFDKICDMSEEEFVKLAGDDAWWRQSEGSNLGTPDTIFQIKGQKMLGWTKLWVDEMEDYELNRESLTEYLCNCIGVSQPRNVCACAMDLAKYNGMSMGELFTKYEG